jgi:ubiquinone/menaquinone biosynthesis C-methylase UbiE
MAAQYLAEQGFAVWGIDLSETAIRWAEERFQRIGLSAHFLVGHVGDIHQCQDAAFELIIDGSCLHCLIDDARSRCFAEVRRLLKPGGRFVVGSMCGTPRCGRQSGISCREASFTQKWSALANAETTPGLNQ